MAVNRKKLFFTLIDTSNENVAANFFITISLVFGFIFIFITPPLQVPDEQAHLFRSFQIARGDILYQSGVSMLPVSLIDFTTTFTDREVRYNADGRQRFSELSEAFSKRINADNSTNIVSHGAMAYPPIPYIGTAFVSFIGILLNTPVIFILYAGRFINILVSSLITFAAIRKTPHLKWFLTLSSLTPMIMFQRSSLSADSITNALAVLSIALTLHYWSNNKIVDNIDIFLIAFANLALSLCKPGYFIISFLILAIPLSNFTTIRRYILVNSIIIFLCVFSTLFWSYLASSQITPRPDLTADTIVAQRDNIISSPLSFIEVIGNTVYTQGWNYARMFIGTFGWMEILAPEPLIIIFIAITIVVSMFDGLPCKSISIRTIALFIFICGSFFIFLPLYLTWTTPGSSVIEGVQGRYFIPIFPLLGISFGFRYGAFQNLIKYISITLVITSSIITIFLLSNRYFLPPDRFNVYDLEGNRPSYQLASENILVQDFSCPVETLRSFDVLVGTHGRLNEGSILYEFMSDGKTVFQKTLLSSSIKDNDWITFRLEKPIYGCFDKNLSLKAEPIDNNSQNGVSIWTLPKYYDGRISGAVDQSFDGRVFTMRFNID